MKKVIFKSLFTSILLVLGLSVGVKQTTHEVVEAATIDVLTIAPSDFSKVSYADNNGEHQKLTDGGINVSYYTNQVMNQNNAIQAQKNAGLIYNKTALEYISKIVLEGTTNGFSVYVGTESNQKAKELTSIDEKTYEVLEGNYSYFTLVNGNVTTRLTSIEVHFQKFDQDYTATLHYNDGITKNGSITSVEGKFTAPEIPTRTGYAFDGWYTDNETFNNLFDFENTFATENIDLYAKWVDEKDTYLQTTSFALGFDYSLNSGIINDASEVTNGLYTISAVVGDKYTVATNTLVTSSVGSNHVLSVNETTEDSTSILNHYTDLFYINKVNDKYTIQTMDGKYLTYGNTTSIELNLETEKTNNSEWTIENNTTTAPGTISIRKSDSFLLGYNTYEGRNEFGVCRSSYNDWYNLELTKIDVATSNYALRFGTEITTENYAKLGEVKSYGVLVAPTAKLGDVTFKDLCSTAAELSTLIKLTEALNITNAKMQTTETGYSFGGLLQNIPETQIHTSVSAACYVVNAAGEIFFAEQKDMSIVGAATYYAEHAAELGLNETETTLVNVLKGM